MKEIFNALGFQVAETRRSIVDKEFTMSLINNPDGSVRWIWPTRLKQPLFLKFYNKQSVKSRVLFTLFRLVFKFHLQSFVFKKKTFFLEQNSLQEMDFDLQSDWALFTGYLAVLFAGSWVWLQLLAPRCADILRRGLTRLDRRQASLCR